VECENVTSRWLGEESGFRLRVTWHDDTAAKAERLRRTIQAKPLVEMASVALALVLARKVVRLGDLDVTEYGERTDFRSVNTGRALEISGTEAPGELGRRHRAKVAQALVDPSGRGAYVIVCSFGARGHRIRMSGHEPRESAHD
jgi:hypothetical protein